MKSHNKGIHHITVLAGDAQWNAGSVDLEIGDGTVRRFSTGDILLAKDTTGRGHKSKAVKNEPRLSVFVRLD